MALRLNRQGYCYECRAPLHGMYAAEGGSMIDLKAFAKEIMKAWPDGGIDGDELQDIAIRHGLLTPWEMTEPCGENCNCAGLSDFPLTCYRIAEGLK